MWCSCNLVKLTESTVQRLYFLGILWKDEPNDVSILFFVFKIFFAENLGALLTKLPTFDKE